MDKGGIPFAVFASGRGTNFEAIQRYAQREDFPGTLVALVTDRPQSLVVQKAKATNLPVISAPVNFRDHATREQAQSAQESEILSKLKTYNPHFIVLAGYMKILSGDFIENFWTAGGYSRIVNIHPSLLPAFPGLNAYEQAFCYGCQQTGATIHLVDREVDNGPICVQEAFSISDCREVEEVERKGLEIENRIYPENLAWILKEEFEVQKRTLLGKTRRVCVRQS